MKVKLNRDDTGGTPFPKKVPNNRRYKRVSCAIPNQYHNMLIDILQRRLLRDPAYPGKRFHIFSEAIESLWKKEMKKPLVKHELADKVFNDLITHKSDLELEGENNG